MAQIIQFPTPNPWAEQMKQEAIAVNEGLEALVAYRWNIVHELEQEPQSNEQLLVACRTLFSSLLDLYYSHIKSKKALTLRNEL